MSEETENFDDVEIEQVLSKIDFDLKMKEHKDKNIILEYYSPVRNRKSVLNFTVGKTLQSNW
jgi:hypothetical protein